MKKEMEHRSIKLERLRSLRNNASDDRIDSRLIKEVEGDNQQIRELPNALFKESMAKLYEARLPREIISLAREESNTNLKNPVSELSRQTSMRCRLPKLQLESRTPVPMVDKTGTPFSPKLSPQRSLQHLAPTFAINNSVSRAAFKSRVGSVHGKPKLHNEDAVIVQGNLQKIRGQYLFALVDGHGVNGYIIAQHIKENFLNTLQFLLPAEPRLDSIEKALISATERLEEDLKTINIEKTFSGATMISVLIFGNVVVCGSLGDCKAIVGNFGSKWNVVGLHCLHNLQNKQERKRMIQNNARIAVQMIEETNEIISTERAYMGGDDVPGLEVTRSIGDKMGKCIGMISTPEIKVYELTSDDKFIVIGTPGLWKVLSETDALCIVRANWDENKIESACEDLISEADRRWKKSGQDKDDISAIVVFLKLN